MKSILIIKDTVFGYISITHAIKQIIDSYPFQRLRRIRQLAGSEYVYPTATHVRFAHCLGVMHLAEQLIMNLAKSIEVTEELVNRIKIAALLHDVGHGPFSHIFESVLINYLDKTHEDMTTWIIAESELAGIIEKQGLDPIEISKLAVGKLPTSDQNYLNQIIASAVDVDSMDYIVRDSHFSGAEYSADIFRLIYTMDVFEGDLAVNLSALSTLEAFLLARYESFKSIYFHKTSRAVQIMLEQALDKAKDELSLIQYDNPLDYLKWDDYSTWTALRNSKSASSIINNIERRKLIKVAYEQTSHMKNEMVPAILTKNKIRKQIEEEIAEETNIDPEVIWIDVPTLPSVPYHHSISLEPMEIPMFVKNTKGEKIAQRMTDVSEIIRVLKGFLNIVRVYTTEEYREVVTKAAEKVFGAPSSARISM
ncbi:MAG: HD domain-containing protein [Candidatus Helarchaeota archaeon]|nr:HD domain-containing protein [Candidatus Helarchaeota archaeon]